jgi:tRNA U34 5-methylaminomethyl-2-thiouridine-forming methyltransferase MnmC
MNREIIITQDGSTTIHLPDWNESYHSKHGAIQEAYHVFIKNGLDHFNQDEISIMEIGFGTGLNAIITLLEAEKRKIKVNYCGVEAYPVDLEETKQLNYVEYLKSEVLSKEDIQNCFNQLHQIDWEVTQQLSTYFSIQKRQQFFHEIDTIEQFDLIYFDAFGYRVQPELWSEEIFRKMYQALKNDGLLTTYACRSVIKKDMELCGFLTQKLSGAPGKREMLNAKKN